MNLMMEWPKSEGTSGPENLRPIYASNVGAEGLTARIAGSSPASISFLPSGCVSVELQKAPSIMGRNY